MRNCLFACFVLLLAGCGNDDKDGERTHDMVIGNENISVPVYGDTVEIKTRYNTFIITSIKLKVDNAVSMMQYQYATLDSIFYMINRDNYEIEERLSLQDSLKHEGIKVWRRESGLSIIVEKNPLSNTREYTITLDDISNYGYVYVTQPSE